MCPPYNAPLTMQHKKFEGITYDVFDIDDKHFDKDYESFAEWVIASEIHIGSVITQGLSDCISVDAAFQLFDSFEGIIERQARQNILDPNPNCNPNRRPSRTYWRRNF